MAKPTATTEPGGLLLVDKPAGITSHDAVAIVRRAVRTRRVGHAGTLDPFATGLLVVLFGRGTRLIPYVPGEPKVYEAAIDFGAETDTDDRTGVVTRTADVPTDAAIDDAIARLTGAIEQVPPSYSAKQVDGTRAYAAARRGAPLELQPVRVSVHSWTLTGRDGDRVTARITCSGGTYIRALARDLGRLTQSAAHLSELRRTASGPFSVQQAASIADIERGAISPRPLTAAIPDLPVQTLSGDDLRRVAHGNAVASRVDGSRAALVDVEGDLVAVADARDGELCPKAVFRDA
jgi:tRNA pseudouridine55 synthase